MELKYVSQLRQLSSREKRELQNLMDNSGMFHGEQLEEFIAPYDFKSALCMIHEQDDKIGGLDHGEICGFAFLEDEESSIVLSHLFVAPAARKHGVGSELVRCVKEFAKERGVGRVELAVDKENLKAKSIYDKAGFEVHHTHNGKFIMTAQTKPREK